MHRISSNSFTFAQEQNLRVLYDLQGINKRICSPLQAVDPKHAACAWSHILGDLRLIASCNLTVVNELTDVHLVMQLAQKYRNLCRKMSLKTGPLQHTAEHIHELQRGNTDFTSLVMIDQINSHKDVCTVYVWSYPYLKQDREP